MTDDRTQETPEELTVDAEPAIRPIPEANLERWQVDSIEETRSPALPAEVALSPPPPLQRILEALLFVGGSPLTEERAAAAIRGLTPQQFTQAIEDLNRDYRRQGRPYAIHAREHGYVLTLRPRFKAVVEQLYGRTREARLTPQAIEVLSLVAYRQPTTKQEIDSIRGLESGGLLRQLVRRGLITVVQRGQPAQRDVAYGTTPRFLELFKLSGLDDLPQTQDLQKL
jgi:segregation and condensation protein B